MSCIVVVPNPIRDEIGSWCLSADAEDDLYKQLQENLGDGHLEKCLRLAAPTPTFIHIIDIQDPDNPWLSHCCTFYLTYGPLDDCAIRHAVLPSEQGGVGRRAMRRTG